MSDDDFDDFYDADDCSDPHEEGPAEVVQCPQCHAMIYEESEQCPICGAYVTWSTNVWSGRSVAWVSLGLAGLIAAIVALVLFG
ncbi:MAG: hypothetical protein JW829_14250 [Pirellulales bacterium]|nr:hypothetical protein [Pirellulales bacterium]